MNSSNCKDYLTDLLTGFHHCMTFGRISKLQRGVNDWLDLASRQQRPHMRLQVLRDGCLERHRAGAKRRTRNRQTPAHQVVRIES